MKSLINVPSLASSMVNSIVIPTSFTIIIKLRKSKKFKRSLFTIISRYSFALLSHLVFGDFKNLKT